VIAIYWVFLWPFPFSVTSFCLETTLGAVGAVYESS